MYTDSSPLNVGRKPKLFLSFAFFPLLSRSKRLEGINGRHRFLQAVSDATMACRCLACLLNGVCTIGVVRVTAVCRRILQGLLFEFSSDRQVCVLDVMCWDAEEGFAYCRRDLSSDFSIEVASRRHVPARMVPLLSPSSHVYADERISTKPSLLLTVCFCSI